MTEYQKKYSVQYFNCECGGKYDTYNLSHHMKTSKHKTYLKLQELLIENQKLKSEIKDLNDSFSTK